MSPFSYIHAIITIFAGKIPDTRLCIWVALLASSCLLTYKNSAKQKGEAHFWMHSVFSEILEAYESCSSVDVTLDLEKKDQRQQAQISHDGGIGFFNAYIL